MYTFRCEDPKHGIQYLTRVSGLTVSQSYPGGFKAAQFTIPGLSQIPLYSRLTVSKGPVVIFDGEIRDQRYQTGPDGRVTAITAYGHGILLKDDSFGPRIYADTRLREWAEPVVGFTFGSFTYAPTKEKFTLSTDGDVLRIAPKPSAVFAGQATGGFVPVLSVLGHDFAGYEYKLPLSVAELPYGTIAQVSLTWACQFPTGSWELVAISSDGASIGVHSISTASGSGTTTITPMAGATSIAVILRAKADQAVYSGKIQDGEGNTVLSTLEYAGRWAGQINTVDVTAHSGEGAMQTQDADTPVTTAKDGTAFYLTGSTTRNGGAARLRFTGRSIALYAEKWGSQGDLEYQIWDKTGASVTGPTTVSANVGSHLTGTVSATSGSATLTGAGTAFTTELTVGDVVIVPRDGSGSAAGDVRRVTAIASNISLTLDSAATTTVSGVLMTTRRFQSRIFTDTLPGFDTYTLTVRNLGTVGGVGVFGAGTKGYYLKVDYFDAGVTGLAPFEQDAVYAQVSAATVKTTTARLDAAQIARDVVAFYSASGINLSASTIRIPTTAEAASLLPALTHLTYDAPTNGVDALEDICALGTSANKPLAWAVWEGKQLWLEEWDTTGARFLYQVEPTDVQIDYEQTVQEDFANVVARVSRDGLGQRVIGLDTNSVRLTTEYGGRKRRVVLTPQESDADAGTYLTDYLANHDRPSIRARVAVTGPIRDQGGAIVPPDEVWAGRLLRVGGLDEWEDLGATDKRSGFTAMITALEWSADDRSLTLDLGDGPSSFERLIARAQRQFDRDKVAG